MNQDTRPAPFNVGDHLRYVSRTSRALPAGKSDNELVLAPGLLGVVIASTGTFPGQDKESPRPWHCRIQFENGFQIDVTAENVTDFEVARNQGVPTAGPH